MKHATITRAKRPISELIADNRIEEAIWTLCDIGTLYERVLRRGPSEVRSISLDFRQLGRVVANRPRLAPETVDTFHVFRNWYASHQHLFRGQHAATLLLQAALGHWTDGPVAKSARGMLAHGIDLLDDQFLLVPHRPCCDKGTGLRPSVLLGHANSISALLPLPGDLLASAAHDKTIRIWDTEAGVCLHVLRGHRDWIRSLAVLPNGRVVSASDDHTVRVWNPVAGECIVVLRGHRDWVRTLTVLPDGRLASAGDDNTIRIWDTAKGSCLRVLRGHTDWIRTLVTLSNGWIASGGDDGVVRVWDPDTGRCVRRFEANEAEILVLAALPGARVASAGHGHEVHVWDALAEGEPRVLSGHRDWVRALAVLPDGRLASAGDDRTVRVWNPDEGCCCRVLEGHTDWIRALIALRSGHLVSAGDDGTVRIWDPDAGACVGVMHGHRDWVRTLAALPGGRLASGDDDGRVHIWDLAAAGSTPAPTTRRPRADSPHEVDARVRNEDLDVPPSGLQQWAEARLWDGNSEVPPPWLHDFDPPVWAGRFTRLPPPWPWTAEEASGVTDSDKRGAISAIAPLPGGRLVTAAPDGTIRVWNTRTVPCEQVLRGHSRAVFCLAALPDGRLVSAGRDRVVRVWEPASGQCVAQLEGHCDWIRALAVLGPDLVASAGDDCTVRVWDLRARRCVHVLEGHTDWVRALAALPNGRVASAGDDFTVRVWDTSTGRCVGVYEGHHGWVLTLAALPDGRVASAGNDGTVCIWPAPPRRPAQRPSPVRPASILRGHAQRVHALAALGRSFADLSASGATMKPGASSPLGFSPRRTSGYDGGKTPAGSLRPRSSARPRDESTRTSGLADEFIASASHDGTVRIWNIRTGRCLHVLEGHGRRITSLVALSPHRLVSAGEDATIRVWDVQLGEQVAMWATHRVPAVVARLDDESFAAGFDDGHVQWFALHKGAWRTVATFPDTHAFAWRPGRRHIALVRSGAVVEIYAFHPWNEEEEHCELAKTIDAHLPPSCTIRSVAWSADGSTLLLTTDSPHTRRILPLAPAAPTRPHWVPPSSTSADGALRGQFEGSVLRIQRRRHPAEPA